MRRGGRQVKTWAGATSGLAGAGDWRGDGRDAPLLSLLRFYDQSLQSPLPPGSLLSPASPSAELAVIMTCVVSPGATDWAWSDFPRKERFLIQKRAFLILKMI